MAIDEKTIQALVNKLNIPKNLKAPKGFDPNANYSMEPPDIGLPELTQEEQIALGAPPMEEPTPPELPFTFRPDFVPTPQVPKDAKLSTEQPSVEDVDLADAAQSDKLAQRAFDEKVAGINRESFAEGAKKVAPYAGTALGLAGLEAGGFPLLSSAAPFVLPVAGAYLAGKSIADKVSGDDKLKEAAQTELKRAEEKGGAEWLNFPETASKGAEDITGGIVPPEAFNLTNTLARAVSGAAKGVVGAGDKAVGVVRDVQKDIAPLANSPFLKLLGNVAAVSDKGNIASAASKLAFGKDITGYDNLNRTGLTGSDPYLTSLDTQAQAIINKPESTRTSTEVKFLESYPENRKAYLASLEQKSKTEQEMKSGSLNMGNMDPKSEQAKEITRWIAASKDIDNMDQQIKFAMSQKDPSVMALVVNKLAGISSVAIQQGVVSDEEARRVLAGVMSNYEQVQAAGFSTAAVQRFLDSSAWKSVINMAKGVNNGLKARMSSYKDIYSIPDEFFSRAKVDLKPAEYSEGDTITQADLDKLNEKAALEAARIKYLTAGQAVPTAVESAIDGLNRWWDSRQKNLNKNPTNPPNTPEAPKAPKAPEPPGGKPSGKNKGHKLKF